LTGYFVGATNFRALTVMSLVFMVSLFVLIYFWVKQGGGGNSDPFGSIGSLHSVRYAWISNYIDKCDYVPRLDQNTGQSILTYIAGSAYEMRPYLILFMWMTSSIFFLGAAFYGVIDAYIEDAPLSLWATTIFMIGNTALSIAHISVIDSGSPFAMNGYTDSLFGVASVLMLLKFYEWYRKKEASGLYLWICAFFVVLSNFQSAPQNVTYLFMLACSLIVISFFTYVDKRLLKNIFLILFVAGVVGIQQGGMLAPNNMHDEIEYSGIMSTIGNKNYEKDESLEGIHILPGFPFQYHKQGGYKQLYIEAQSHIREKNYGALFWVIEEILWITFRVLFFPIIGMIWLIYIWKRGYGRFNLGSNVIDLENYRPLVVAGSVAFIYGFAISFPFVLNGYKWELSRFMIPFISIGMLGFGLFVIFYTENIKYRRLIRTLILIVLVLGPVHGLVMGVYSNIVSANQNDFDELFSMGPNIESCNK